VNRPRLLDLFCCGGGASMGYHRAGFDVVGIDIDKQPAYPFEFHQADALEYLAAHWHEFDAIHASPPCQENTRAGKLREAQGRPLKENGGDMLPETRAALEATGLPYVIENVEGATMQDTLLLCGSMFPELRVTDETGTRWLQRHRLFESNAWLMSPGTCEHATAGIRPLGVYYKLGDNVPSGGQTARTLEEAQALMGIDWLPFSRLKEAIPPAYTEWIGTQLIDQLEMAA
jgi:DNA (cytosine-5)-methyltransferase 1